MLQTDLKEDDLEAKKDTIERTSKVLTMFKGGVANNINNIKYSIFKELFFSKLLEVIKS